MSGASSHDSLRGDHDEGSEGANINKEEKERMSRFLVVKSLTVLFLKDRITGEGAVE